MLKKESCHSELFEAKHPQGKRVAASLTTTRRVLMLKKNLIILSMPRKRENDVIIK